jgi:putative membrane protein (TIGR04086 family)
MKNYLKPMLYILGIILGLLLLLTIFNYLNIITGTFLNIMKFLIPVIALFVGGIMIGKISSNKGWLNGLKLSLILIVLFFILSLIFSIKIDFKNLIYYLILAGSSMFGSMIGINKKHL